MVNTAGKVVGEHKGAYFYTIGQRGGLGIGGNAKPLYVAEKDVKENALLVAEENDPALYKKEVNLTAVNLMKPELRIKNKELKIQVMARVRYRQPLFPALFIIHNLRLRLIFNKPQKFVAQGQSAVFYSAKKGDLRVGLPAYGGAGGDQGRDDRRTVIARPSIHRGTKQSHINLNVRSPRPSVSR